MTQGFSRERLARIVPFLQRAYIETGVLPGAQVLLWRRGETVLERREEDGWLELYAFDRSRVSDGEIAAANYFCATWDDAPFGSHLLLGCYAGDARYGVFDRSLTIERADGSEQREFSGFEEFADFIQGTAGIGLEPHALGEAWRKIAPAS